MQDILTIARTPAGYAGPDKQWLGRMETTVTQLRRCLREPIPEIELAASMLEQAVAEHVGGRRDSCAALLRDANMPVIREWSESIWGKASPYAPSGAYWSELPDPVPSHTRMPDIRVQGELHARDGYYCRFCSIPVVRKPVRERLRMLYPDVPIWGRRNTEQHAALQCMWAQYDHLVPHSRGGSNDLCNLVVTCAPCNYGRMQYTLEEAALLNPLERTPRIGPWRGLEHALPAKLSGNAA